MKVYYLVSYDITNDKIRTKVANILDRFGTRWQYSVFLCFFSKREIQFIRSELHSLISKNNDSVIFIPLRRDMLNKIEEIGKKKEAFVQHTVHFDM